MLMSSGLNSSMRGTALQLGKEWTGVGADLGANCRNASYCQTEYVNTIVPLYTAAPSPMAIQWRHRAHFIKMDGRKAHGVEF